jgi:hypothetical protein
MEHGGSRGTSTEKKSLILKCKQLFCMTQEAFEVEGLAAINSDLWAPGEPIFTKP